MASLLEMPAIRERVHRFTVDEYHRLPWENVELLRGIVVTKMPKSPLHVFVTDKLTTALLACVPPGFKVRKEEPLTLRDSEPEPDVAVVRGKAEDWATVHPSTAYLVIEVAISSFAVDEEKAEIYSEAGIP